ncbi:MAG: hypothetical protein Q8P56_06790 [Candidatus Uhrbacteria bacterium]|nr:hypothetical protein [Candidatus Uhrbacteria bacterium]
MKKQYNLGLSKSRHAKQKGSALLISVIIASALLIVGVEVSMFVVSTIRQARSIDQTLVASYAAESGVESALHQIRKEGRTTLRADTQTSPALYSVDGCNGSCPTWTFKKGNGIDPEKFNTSVDTITKSFLGEQEAIDIHLYTTDDAGFTVVTDRMANMVVSWKSHVCASDSDVPSIETTAESWPLTSHIVEWNKSSTLKDFQKAAPDALTVTVPLSQLIPSDQTLSTTGITLRVKPFFCSLREISITFPDKDNAALLVGIPNYVRIAPLGTFGSSQKTLTVLAPQKSGVTGIFDFALFSEEMVDKKEQ